MKINRKLTLDFLVVLLIVLVSIPLVLKLRLSFLVATFLFFVVPTIFLLLRKPVPFKRVIVASALFGFLLFQMDLIAEFNRAWVLPRLFFTHRILGIASVDAIIWGVLWVFLILVFYEHFLEKERSGKVSRNFWYLFTFSIGFFVLTLAKLYGSAGMLKLNYAYFMLGILALLIFVLVMLKIKKPAVIFRKFLLVSVFFAFLHLAHELTSLHLGHWYFPGQYIANVRILGITFPFEEFFFWILISTAIVVSWYEFFVDDEK